MTSRPNKRKNILQITGITLGTIALIAALLIGIFFYMVHKGAADFNPSRLENGPVIPLQETVEKDGKKYVYNKNAVAIAMIGVDKDRLGDRTADQNPIGMADLTAMVVLDRSTGKMTLLNIPRDTVCDVDVYRDEKFITSKKQQICTAFSYGDGKKTSCDNVVLSMRRLLDGAPIVKYVCLDMDGIATVTDALGGVPLVPDMDLPDFNIYAGKETIMTGKAAQVYLRFRDHDQVDGSGVRTSRQTQYFAAMTARLFHVLKHDFGRLPGLYAKASSRALTDITLENATYLGTLLVRQGTGSLDTRTLAGRFEAEAIEGSDDVYARFIPDSDALQQTILDLFYKPLEE